MTITTEQIYLLNNRAGRVASNVQLGTLIQNAETISAGEVTVANGKFLVGNASNVGIAVNMTGDITFDNTGLSAIGAGKVLNAMVGASAAIDFSKLAAMTSGYLLVGSAGTVPTAVAMSGDVTIVAAGTTTIGAAKITEAMLKTQQLAGLHPQRMAHCIFDPTGTAGDRTIAAHTLGATIPINAFVTGVWYWVETTLTSGSSTATVALSIEGANDVVTAIAINDGTTPWNNSAKPVEGVTKIETTSTWLRTTAARAVTATVAVEALTGGRLHVWVDYFVYG